MIYNIAMVLKHDLLDTKILYSVYEYSIFCNEELLSKIIIQKMICNIKMHVIKKNEILLLCNIWYRKVLLNLKNAISKLVFSYSFFGLNIKICDFTCALK